MTDLAFYLGIAALVAMLLTFAFIICGARYDDTLNNTTDERSEIKRAIDFGAGADFLHGGAVGAEGQSNHG